MIISIGSEVSGPVLINAGIGSRGVYVEDEKLEYEDSIGGCGSWYGMYHTISLIGVKRTRTGLIDCAIACNNTLLYGPAVQLFWKEVAAATAAECEKLLLHVEYVS